MRGADVPSSEIPRGRGDQGSFTSATNDAGGTVVSEGTITRSDFAPYVHEAVERGEKVNILSGQHGVIDPDGMVRTPQDKRLLVEDRNAFGDMPGVTVHDAYNMEPSQIREMIEGPGTTIGGFCNSAACLGVDIE